MIKDNYVRRVIEVVRVIDGDTIEAWVDMGDYTTRFMVLRFLGVNTPERNRDGYYEAREFVEQAIEGQTIHIQTVKEEKYYGMGFGKGGFGRYLATVFIGEGESQYNLNERLLELGLAKVYKR